MPGWTLLIGLAIPLGFIVGALLVGAFILVTCGLEEEARADCTGRVVSGGIITGVVGAMVLPGLILVIRYLFSAMETAVDMASAIEIDNPVSGSAVQVEVNIAADPESVWPFLTDQTKMSAWIGVNVVLDARPGGGWRVGFNAHDVASGKYVEVVPYSRVLLSWGWEGEGSLVPVRSSTVEFTLEAEGGNTRLRLIHGGLPVDQIKGHHESWDHYMARLVMLAEGKDPGPDPRASAG